MIGLSVYPTGDGMLGDVDPASIVDVTGAEIRIGALANGTEGGHPSITICVKLPDGRWLVTQTTLKLLLSAADLFKGKYGDPRT